MKFKKLLFGLGVIGCGLLLSACGSGESNNDDPIVDPTPDPSPDPTPQKDPYKQEDLLTKSATPKVIEVSSVNKVTESSLYIRKIENLTDDFIMGMDSSAVISLEAAGVKYYDYDGTEKDVFEILAESGINTIRVRVWNDPYDADGNGYGGGNCDIEKCIEIGKRATKYGLGLMVDFHYSDFWADPAKQMVPKAWKGITFDEKEEALYRFTYNSLVKLYNEGVNVTMVQVGNETITGLCGETDWVKMCKLFSAGSKAVREVFPSALVALHFANPEKPGRYSGIAEKLNANNVDYDVFASSYYPYWHGTIDNLSTVLSEIATTYNKKVMVAETAYGFTEEDSDFYGNTGGNSEKPYPFSLEGQVNEILDITDAIVNNTTNGIGVCYWEGTWITTGGSSYEENLAMWNRYGTGWASQYAVSYDSKDAKNAGGCAVDNQAFFDSTGKALESLKLWQLMKNGNITEKKAIGTLNTSCSYYDSEDIKLPETVTVLYNSGEKIATPVTWNFTDEDIAAAKKGGNNVYAITGTAAGLEVTCSLTILEYNYVTNYSFEQGANGWTYTNLNTVSYQLKVRTDNHKTGSSAFGFWSSDANTVKWTLEQKITGLATGTYKYTVSLIGGANGTTDSDMQDIYMYVKIDGEIVYKLDMKFTTYNDGFKDFILRDISYTEGQELTIGIYCEANQAGSWADFDDFMLNYQG